jgi:hypothetical protein
MEDKKVFHNNAKVAHQILFCLLLDKKFGYAGDPDRRMSIIADVVVYSNLYVCREAIAARILKDLASWDGYFQDAGSNPEFYFGLSQLLQCENMYSKALGCLVARYCYHKADYPYSYNGSKEGGCYGSPRTPMFSPIDIGGDFFLTKLQDLKSMIFEYRDQILPLPVKIFRCLHELTINTPPSREDQRLGLEANIIEARGILSKWLDRKYIEVGHLNAAAAQFTWPHYDRHRLCISAHILGWQK